MTSFKKTLLMTAAATLMVAASANATTITFTQISTNGNQSVASQLSVKVIDLGGGQVAFEFYNAVGTASTISEIYFADGTLLGIDSITDSDGTNSTGVYVDFVKDAKPAQLPGGGSFNTTQSYFAAEANEPAPKHGINESTDWVRITFSLINGQSYADTLAALADGSLKIGLHVTGIGGAGSESFVNNPYSPVPDGGSTMMLLGSALFGLGMIGRKFRKG